MRLFTGQIKTFDLSKISLIRWCTTTSESQSKFIAKPPDEVEERVTKKPVSVMPDHLPYPHLRTRSRIRLWWKVKETVEIKPLEDNALPEWSETPEYPEIVDDSNFGKKKRFRMEWYDGLKRLPSAQEKVFEMSKHFRFFSLMLSPTHKQYHQIDFQKYITRTHLVSGGLPDQYNIDVDALSDKIQNLILDRISMILFDAKQRLPKFLKRPVKIGNLDRAFEKIKQENIANEIANVLRKVLINQYDHLENSHFDYVPFVANSWFNQLKIPFSNESYYPNPTTDQCLLYKSEHALHIRTDKPLKSPLPMNDPLCVNSEIPKFESNPLHFGYSYKRHNLTYLPGFWPDNSDGFDFPFMLFLTRSDLNKIRKEIDERFFNEQEVLDGMAILSGFAWLSSIAAHQGFTIYNDLTYPLTTNIIITDGQFWSFYVYQLNTHAFHSDVDKNDRRNICWSSGNMKLFDSYENGQFQNVNLDVIKNILRLFVSPTQIESSVNYFPYLNEDIRTELDKEVLNYHLRRRFGNYKSSFIMARVKRNDWEAIFKYGKNKVPLPHIRTRPKWHFKFPPHFKK